MCVWHEVSLAMLLQYNNEAPDMFSCFVYLGFFRSLRNGGEFSLFFRFYYFFFLGFVGRISWT